MKSKEFDSVKMMRDIRQKLGRKYYGQPEMLPRDLEVIRKKYALVTPTKRSQHKVSSLLFQQHQEKRPCEGYQTFARFRLKYSIS